MLLKKILILQLIWVCCYATAQTPANKPKKAIVNTKEQPQSANAAASSTIIPIQYEGPLTPAADAKDRLLWYKGKKINDSMLITPQASLVLFSKKREMIVVQPPAKSDPSMKLIERLQSIKDHKKRVVAETRGKKNGFFLYEQVMSTFKKFDEQNETFSTILKNSISLPPPVVNALHHSSGTSGYASARPVFVKGVPERVRMVYEDVMRKMKNYPPIDFSEPPADNMSICMACDGIAKNNSFIENFKWRKEFSGYENDIMDQSFSIYRTLEQLRISEDPEAIQIAADLQKAMKFAIARMNNKVDLLIRKYGNDFTRLSSVIHEAIAIERQKQLLNMSEPNSYAQTITKLISLLDGFDKYLDQQIAKRNYDVVLNLAFIIGIERQRQLLAGSGDDNKVKYYMDKYLAFNRFKIEMDADFSMSCNDEDGECKFVSASGKLETKRDFYVSLAPDSCGKFGMFLTNTFYKPETEDLDREMYYATSPVEMDVYSIQFDVLAGQESVTTVDDEGNPKIITTRLEGGKILMHLPLSRISFCEGTNDSIFLNAFYNKGDESAGPGNRMQQILNLIYATVPQEKIEEYMPEMVANTQAYQKRMKEFDVEPTGYEQLDQQQNQYRIIETYEKNKMKGIMSVMSKEAAITFDAENGMEQIVSAEADMSGSKVENININKGVVRIKIRHDPEEVKSFK
jgi:hypothetical protein